MLTWCWSSKDRKISDETAIWASLLVRPFPQTSIGFSPALDKINVAFHDPHGMETLPALKKRKEINGEAWSFWDLFDRRLAQTRVAFVDGGLSPSQRSYALFSSESRKSSNWIAA